MAFIFTQRARTDLGEIARYVAEDNPKDALRVADAIYKTCETIDELPNLGRFPYYVRETDVRFMSVNKYTQYVIFYRQTKNVIEILRIIHGARDLPNSFYKK